MSETIKKYINTYKKVGKEYVSLCPFHEEKTPSFHFTDNGLFYCFGCGISGNERKFISLLNIDDDDAVNDIVNGAVNDIVNDVIIKHRISDKIIRQFKINLWKNNEAFAYLVSRGIKPFIIKSFNIGWDYYSSYYTIPIYDDKGIVNIKLHNSFKKQKSMWYLKERKYKYLYPFKNLKYNKLVICEGEMDCMLLNSYEVKAVTSTNGCSYINQEWREILKDKIIYIVYDNDDAGIRASETLFGLLKENCNVKVFSLAENKDITELYLKNKKEFIKLINMLKS